MVRPTLAVAAIDDDGPLEPRPDACGPARRHLQPLPTENAPGRGELLDLMASALLELHEFVPHHAWWDSGAAGALLQYQATRH